jgi:type I restriction enzyme S subunit
MTTAPKIRFPGFTDDWEQRKLGELGKCQSGVGFPEKEQGGKSGVPFFKVSDMNNQGNEHEMITANNYVSEDQIARMKWKPVEDVPALFFAKVGAAVMLNRKRLCKKPFLLDNNTMAYKLFGCWNTDFAKAIFETIDLTSLTQVGALPSYNAGDVEEMVITLPMNFAEQMQIGTFFKNVDDLITLHQRKLDNEKMLKQGLLQKMFPKNGKDIPEIRFPGFTDAWEQRKLGEICTITMGQSPYGSTYSDTPSDYILVQGNADLFDGWVKPRIWTTQMTKKGNAGDLIMSVRAPAGAMGKTAYDVVLGRGVAAIKGNEFVYQSLVKMDLNGYWKKLSAGSTFESINSNAVINAVLMIPPKNDEQQQIGTFFKNLDDLITLHQRKLDNFKQLKQALLQQMFI